MSKWDRVAAEVARQTPRRSRRRGRVTGFDLASVPREVFVDVGSSGVSIPMRFCGSYAPTINDEVLIDWEGDDPVVIDKLA